MTIYHFIHLKSVHPSWKPYIHEALAAMDPLYLESLDQNKSWLPGSDKLFNAFNLPIDQVRYVLFGESPYPRIESANGYAFWDASVHELWSDGGLSKRVNRAVSLRNFMKMLLVAEGMLAPEKTGTVHIKEIDKKKLIKTNAELFHNLIQHGFLLLNASLVLQPTTSVAKDAKAWRPFMSTLLSLLQKEGHDLCFILFGNIANNIKPWIRQDTSQALYAEHPYNHSFITNQAVIDFFRPLHLLSLPPTG